MIQCVEGKNNFSIGVMMDVNVCSLWDTVRKKDLQYFLLVFCFAVDPLVAIVRRGHEKDVLQKERALWFWILKN